MLPALGTILYNEVEFRKVRGTEVRQSALRTAELVSLEMQQVISGSEGILEAIAAAPVVKTFTDAECTAYLGNLIVNLPQFNAISAIDAQGNMRCRSRPAAIKTGYTSRPYFPLVMNEGRFVLGEYTISQNDGTALLPMAAPILGDEAKPIGVLVAGLSLDWLGDRLRERRFAPDSSLTIADRNGTIIAREPFPERFVGTKIPEAFQHLVNADSPGTLELISQDGTPRVQGYYPTTAPPEGIYISAGLSRREAFRGINEATQRNLVLAALSAILAMALSLLLSRQLVLQPVRRLQATIDLWRSGRTEARTGMKRNQDEISQMGASVDEFLDELQAAREAQKRLDQERELLTGEMQHRIKNILSNVQAIASQSFNGQVDQAVLDTYNERLIAMGNAQAVLAGENWTQAEIGKIVRESTGLFGEPERFQINGPALVLNAKAAMALSMALHELCTNAVKYGALNDPDGQVKIVWHVSDEPNAEFTLSWREQDGPPVLPPTRSGFGTMMVQKVFAMEVNGTTDLRYETDGVTWTVTAPLDGVLAHSEG